MNVILDLCVVPIGVDVSLSPYVAACERVLREAGLKTVLHANGTNIEGDWDPVFAAIKRCHEVVHDMGAPRIFTAIKLGTRTDREQTMQDKVESVLDKLEAGQDGSNGTNQEMAESTGSSKKTNWVSTQSTSRRSVGRTPSDGQRYRNSSAH